MAETFGVYGNGVTFDQMRFCAGFEAIRGIKCDRVMEGLMKKDLVCEKGRSDAVGRPILYGTTDTFLKNFGFSSLKELPPIDDIEGVMAVDADLNEPEDDDPVTAGQIKFDF